MKGVEELEALVRADRWRMRVLNLLSDLNIDGAYITGCFARDAVWDAAHGRAPQPIDPVEVTYVDHVRTQPDIDIQLQIELSARAPNKAWSVDNAGRSTPDVHDMTDVLRRMSDTTRAVAVRVVQTGKPGGIFEVLAPFGLDDVFGMVLRPTPGRSLADLEAEAETERWLRRFPRLKFAEPSAARD